MGRPSLWAIQGVRILLQGLQKAMDCFKQRVPMIWVCSILQASPLVLPPWKTGALGETRAAAGPRGKGKGVSLDLGGDHGNGEQRGVGDTLEKSSPRLSQLDGLRQGAKERLKNYEKGSDLSSGVQTGSQPS